MRRAACLAILAAALSSCGGGAEPAAAPSEATGVITRIERDASGDVSSFTLEGDGEEREVLIAPDVDYGFDLTHLDEHSKTRDPVHCRLELRDGKLYALSIDDA